MSTIAKLLANENITVVEGNYRTAAFDLKSRTLMLPKWAHLSKALKDLFIGHEVGHALFTPMEGWHDAITKRTAEDLKLPPSLLNIIEDVRIERMIQARYPGLVLSFMKGYRELFDADFFGTADREFEDFNFIDRINIKSKLRELADVPFEGAEIDLYNEVQSCEEWSDVVAVAEKIVAFIKENKESTESETNEAAPSMPEDMGDEGGSNGLSEELEDFDDFPMGGDSLEGEEEDTGTGSASTTEEGESETGDDEGFGSSGDSAEEPTDNTAANSNAKGEEGDLEDAFEDDLEDELYSETDEAFRNNEKDLVEDDIDSKPTTVHGFNDYQMGRIIRTMDEVEAMYAEQLKEVTTNTYNPDAVREDTIKMLEMAEREVNDFIKASKPAVNVMIKEFKLRQNASRNARAQQANSGTIDCQKLYSYKYNDDIFKRVTNLADGKNHGMVMFIDASGSMQNTIGDVTKQLIQLHLFCKAVNIPYEAYTFTCNNDRSRYEADDRIEVAGVINHQQLQLVKVMSSDMTRQQAQRSMQLLWSYYNLYLPNRIQGWHVPPQMLGLGSTPLVPTLVAAHNIVKTFMTKNRVEKMNTIILSDGEPTGWNVYGGVDGVTYRGVEFNIHGTKTKSRNLYVGAVVALQESLKKATGTDVINFFIADQTKDAMSYISRRNGYGCPEVEEVRKAMRKNQPCIFYTIEGSDQTIILKSGNFTGEDDEFAPNEGISKQQMRKQFGKYMNSKKQNRIIFTNFAKQVAEAS